jgi:hypothetical protein
MSKKEKILTGYTPSDSIVFKNVNVIEVYLEFFAVRSKDGKYFRSVGFSGKQNWVDDIKKAKIYQKIGQARARVTWFAKHYPEFETAEIIKIFADKAEILNEKERVNKVIEKQALKEFKEKEKKAKLLLKTAEDKLKKAQEEVNKLKNK